MVVTTENFYYRRGELIGLIPTPTTTTADLYTGTGTVSSSTVTDSSASWNVNELIQKIVTIDSTIFVIVSNTATTFTCDGTPTTGSQAYTIHKRGLEIWYTELPDELTSDATELAGKAEDHYNILHGVLSRLFLMTDPPNPQMAEYHRRLYVEKSEERRLEDLQEQASPVILEPWNIRSDLA